MPLLCSPVQGREIILKYEGNDIEADRALLWKEVRSIEVRYLSYFIDRPGIFEDDAHERLNHHFFFVPAEGRVILLQAESSNLPTEIVAEVQDVFKALFRKN